MIDSREEDQAAGLRRLFHRAPPAVVALYATGRHRACSALQAAYRIAGENEQVLILDEAGGEDALNAMLDLPAGMDLLGVLGGHGTAASLLQPIPGLLGRVPIEAAALALPLLDDERRACLVDALAQLHRRAGAVLIHSSTRNAADPSPFIFAAPRHLLVAEASRSGANEACQLIRKLAAAGASALHVAVARADSGREGRAFFDSLNAFVRARIGLSLIWLGRVEHDNLLVGLERKPMPASAGAEKAFLHRLERLARSGSLSLANVR